MTSNDQATNNHDRFSYGEPSTFQSGTDAQQNTLRAIGEEEFSLNHLPEEERNLVEEALRKSAIEVQHSCVIEKYGGGTYRAFFNRKDMQEHLRFSPGIGVTDLLTEGKDKPQSPEWKKIEGDYTDYPYPLSDAEGLPKVVPVNLSSIRAVDHSATHISFTAQPSALLFAGMAPKDRILSRQDLAIDFDVDRETVRVTRQSMYIRKPTRVYFGIKITDLVVTYNFDHDPVVDRNVLTNMHHVMKGSIGLVFRPQFSVDTKLTYIECTGEAKNRSYLFESMDAISALAQSSGD